MAEGCGKAIHGGVDGNHENNRHGGPTGQSGGNQPCGVDVESVGGGAFQHADERLHGNTGEDLLDRQKKGFANAEPQPDPESNRQTQGRLAPKAGAKGSNPDRCVFAEGLA